MPDRIVPTDTGIVHGPETRAASTLEGMRRVDNALLTGGMRAAFGWDAVPDTRDVRPDVCGGCGSVAVWGGHHEGCPLK
jgi:hypothetical protein